ncbi:hypothetical protein B0T10DRAFT_577337 [Thelonectria olida]|uniref:Uncharacterized protein n=1 Tax=Thelonectria olida TaxID=1576542 RepID=A0A9P8VYB9_9HYPO|nr:hypothetical protein B0T10DRAFT_577337 [Thelonectria olida]
MLVRDMKRLSLFIGPTIVFLYLGVGFYRHSESAQSQLASWVDPGPVTVPSSVVEALTNGNSVDSPDDDRLFEPPLDLSPQQEVESPAPQTPQENIILPDPDENQSPNTDIIVGNSNPQHQEIFSISTLDRKFFSIDFGQIQGMNPNIIPHPTLQDTWIVVAQRVKDKDDKPSPWFTEIMCNAVFQDNVLRCLHPPYPLPVSATPGAQCDGDFAHMNFNIGPHDARVFFGPETPYIIFGSNSIFTCFGQFAQDFRMLVDSGFDRGGPAHFRLGTELQRPPPWSKLEKNWFLFWASDGQVYAHYDVAPKRTFALLGPDGSAGPDLGLGSAQSDEACLAKYLPKLASELESIHQATNSLKITMCRRQDPSCAPDEHNTFLFTIYQHKTYYSYHSVYEPYVMVFNQRAPFEIHAMSKKPVWIHGRERQHDKNTSDMFYVTSMSWKNRDLKYHGYLDDELLIGFGIEDVKSGGIDVLAGDILENIGLCNET